MKKIRKKIRLAMSKIISILEVTSVIFTCLIVFLAIVSNIYELYWTVGCICEACTATACDASLDLIVCAPAAYMCFILCLIVFEKRAKEKRGENNDRH
jgi:hypothetical protein